MFSVQRDEIDQAHLRGGPEAAAAVADRFAERGLHADVERDIADMLQGWFCCMLLYSMVGCWTCNTG